MAVFMTFKRLRPGPQQRIKGPKQKKTVGPEPPDSVAAKASPSLPAVKVVMVRVKVPMVKLMTMAKAMVMVMVKNNPVC